MYFKRVALMYSFAPILIGFYWFALFCYYLYFHKKKMKAAELEGSGKANEHSGALNASPQEEYQRHPGKRTVFCKRIV